MGKFLFTFIPLFVAVDSVGLIPVFVTLTQGCNSRERTKILIQSLITATSIAIGFIFLGKFIFNILSISIHDFMIGGGIILLIFAIRELILPKAERASTTKDDIGVVPMGTPLITGPAVLVTCLILLNSYGVLLTLSSLFVNMVIAGIVLYCSSFIGNVFGKEGVKALSKVIMLILAAIAVMFIRKGIEGAFL